MIKAREYDRITATPVKSFFVSMLTRDIKLEDAVLDLLDNCVDGILRSVKKEGDQPYSGFRAEIEFGPDSFSISDNCGGIPWRLHEYAFRMGRAADRPPDAPGVLGTYGIGMKRAIFKMGRHSLISTRNEGDHYEVEIPATWLDNESEWSLSVTRARRVFEEDGTAIVVADLYPGIAKRFGEDGKAFKTELERLISTHYAYIIDKGFEVRINGESVKPHAVKIVFEKSVSKEAPVVRPYLFRATADDVEIFLAVGFTRGIPSQSEILDEQESRRYSSIEAGWTILCNDRAVVHSDRSELTGWGEAGVPRYHTQFIAISGIVEFRSEDPRRLPTTTTKRGIDASAALYLQVKNKMREGMRIFTDFTNKWKTREDEARKYIGSGIPLSLDDIKAQTQHLHFTPATKYFPHGEQYKPGLPLPPRLEPRKRRISFVRDMTKIRTVAGYLGDSDMDPSEVGEKCFDAIYEEARK